MDPSLINKKQHDGPLMLKDDRKEFQKCKTDEERKETRKELHKRARAKCAAYIVSAWQFLHDEGRDEILAPYNFEYVQTLAFDI